LLGSESARRWQVVRHVEVDPLQLRPGLLVLDASLVVDQGVQHVEPDFALRHLHFLVLEEIPELVAFAVHRIQAGRA
jgi:hypothetical protein